MLESRNSFITEHDLYLFHQGKLFKSYRIMGSHMTKYNGQTGVHFAVWSPNAQEVAVIGDFNNWDSQANKMKKINDMGIWTTFVPRLETGDIYKYQLTTRDGRTLVKADPYAFFSELRPKTASIVYPLTGYQWHDQSWQEKQTTGPYKEPLNIYEVHLGTWLKKEDGSHYNYRELAEQLVEYVMEMGYTHIEIMPINEHPLDRSWGYQVTGYYAVTSRYGNPDDFKYFVDYCHQNGIGVIIDWVPGHFCKDGHGLIQFDGIPLYEYSDFDRAEKLEWGTLTFNFSRHEVQTFLISNAYFWFDVFHIDGIRVDAVASMLYLDSRDGSQEERINKEAVDFLRELNKAIFKSYPRALMIAEESSAWPLVTAPIETGGLGFNYKWNMGWMNDMLEYMEKEPVYRKWHHNLITFSMYYAFSENFILPISHDEVVYGKKSLLNKMPGDYWQKFANLRVFIGYMMTHPGKKLMFMGGEFGQFDEWKFEGQLDWFLTDYEMHGKYKRFTNKINNFYLEETALWQLDHEQAGFEWIDPDNNENSIISFIRRGEKEGDYLLVICNFTPQYYQEYKIGVPEPGNYLEVFNSDLEQYGGSGKCNSGSHRANKETWHYRPYHISIEIPPLAMIVFKHQS